MKLIGLMKYNCGCAFSFKFLSMYPSNYPLTVGVPLQFQREIYAQPFFFSSPPSQQQPPFNLKKKKKGEKKNPPHEQKLLVSEGCSDLTNRVAAVDCCQRGNDCSAGYGRGDPPSHQSPRWLSPVQFPTSLCSRGVRTLSALGLIAISHRSRYGEEGGAPLAQRALCLMFSFCVPPQEGGQRI